MVVVLFAQEGLSQMELLIVELVLLLTAVIVWSMILALNAKATLL